MAKGIAGLLGNTKTRTLVLIVLGVLIFGVVIAVSQTDSKHKSGPDAAPSKTTGVPNEVKSTPGGPVSRQYQELQQQDNQRGAANAAKKGTTFIPTLTGNAQGINDKDFEKQLSSAYSELGGKCSKDRVDELSKKGMDTTAIILQLKTDGCSPSQIASLFTSEQIAAALLSEKSCTATGCSADAVKALKAQGQDETKIVAALKAAGCATADIVSSLKANGVPIAKITTALKANNVALDEITTALKENGYNAEEIVTALKESGYDPTEIATTLAKSGFAKNEILAALTKAGFSPVDVSKALNALNGGTTNPAILAQQTAAAEAARRLQAQQEAQQLAAYSQQREGKIKELVSAMDTERKSAMDVWTQTPEQLFTQGDWAQQKAREAAEDAKGGNAGTSTSRRSKNSKDDKTNKIILKAGSILFAVLDTAVDSDEAGPVMATIVGGSLKGSKLLGTMSSNLTSESISLNFSAINMPNEANSMGISAVAIDPDTARTALASEVDHHYLYRWGSLLASSFVQGYASAVANSGSSSTTSQGAAGVTTTTSSPQQSGRQQLFSGIAAIGTKWSQVVGQNFERPITITIDQGTGIGVLVTADLVYGTNPIFYTPPSMSAATTAATAPGALPTTPGATPIPSAVGSTTGLSNDTRQALWNLLQSQPVTTQAAGGGNVVTTTTMGGAPP